MILNKWGAHLSFDFIYNEEHICYIKKYNSSTDLVRLKRLLYEYLKFAVSIKFRVFLNSHSFVTCNDN